MYVRFHCDFNDWEMELVAGFLHLLVSRTPIVEGGDRVWWKLKKNGELMFGLFIRC